MMIVFARPREPLSPLNSQTNVATFGFGSLGSLGVSVSSFFTVSGSEVRDKFPPTGVVYSYADVSRRTQ